MYENQCSMMRDKTILRKEYKNIRKNIADDKRVYKEKLIETKFFEILNSFVNKIRNVFIYNSFSSEVRTGEIISKLINSEYRVYVPKCNESNETMIAAVYKVGQNQTKNSYGIYEPDDNEYADENIDLIVAPGICFDRFGTRIGFGKGYYDKFINSLAYKPIVVAICFSEQIFDGEIPRDEHDCIMDYIVTDKEIIHTKEKK